VGYSSKIFKTTNGGNDWTSKTSGITNYLMSVYFTDSNTGWAVGDFGTILKTTNGGDVWTSQPSGTTYGLWSVHFTNVNTGWAVGSAGTILKTTNGGDAWTSQSSGINHNLKSIHFNDNNTGWAVGSAGTILKTTNGGITFINEGEIDKVPTEFILSQNYPNPFNPSTKITYTIPSRSDVNIKVFNLLGSEVAELVKGEMEAGNHDVEFNAANLPSGVYFYRMQAGNFIGTKKMLLLK
jgi:hypothetical protein